MSEISESRRAVAKAAAAAFGGQPHVDRFYDDDESHAIDILSCVDQPFEGLVSYSTVGLHESPNLLDGNDIRVELAGVAPAGVEAFPNLLATAAFNVMKDGWLAAPGVVYPELVTEYELSSTLDHVMFTEPYVWEELGPVTVADNLKVHWLLALPIAESERQLLHDAGYDALDEALEAGEANYADLNRPPVV